MGEVPEPEPDPEPERERGRASYTPFPAPRRAERASPAPWLALGAAALLAAGAAGLWAVYSRGAPAPPPGGPTTPAPAAPVGVAVERERPRPELEAPPKTEEAIELWLSDTKGDQGDVAEVWARGSLLERVTLTSRGTLVRVPLAYSGEPVLVEIVMAQDLGGRGVDFRATPVRPLYALVMANSWIQPYQVWRVTDYPMKARLGRRFHFSNSIEALTAVEPGRGGRQGVTKP